MKILIINAGSSSLKFRLYDMDTGRSLADGNCQRVGLSDSEIRLAMENGKKLRLAVDLKDHGSALGKIVEILTSGETKTLERISDIDAVGHRVSMGGPDYVSSVVVNDDVIGAIEELSDITPLHTPPQVATIRACRELLGEGFPMVAAFDTAFHTTIPLESRIFSIPYKYYEKYNVRRYGFHGLSHQYVVERYAALTGKELDGTRIVTCHLGGGSSLTAVKDGKSFNNTFGLGTGMGVLCGTRAGDFDHVAIGYIMQKENLTYDEVEDILHRQSGLLGVSGISSDERELEKLAEEGNERARLALDVMARQVRRYIGAYAFDMGGLDTIIFTGGIGENSDMMRAMVCEGLEEFGIALDGGANTRHNRSEHKISTDTSKADIWIIPTNEEWIIARDTQKLVGGR